MSFPGLIILLIMGTLPLWWDTIALSIFGAFGHDMPGVHKVREICGKPYFLRPGPICKNKKIYMQYM